MTCRGYDPKAIKLPKSVKRAACNILDSHTRGAFIRSYVRVIATEGRGARKGDSK